MRIHEISQLGTVEYAQTLATWHTLINPQFQCKEAEERYEKRKDAEIVIEHERKRKGCGVISKETKVEIDGINFHSCLCHDNFKDITISDYLFLHDQFKIGTLAFEGALLSQPSKYIELMKLINRLRNEYEAEMQKSQQQGSK